MLSEVQKEAIRAEEIYRREVRQEEEHQKPLPSTGERAFAFLNSGLGLFLLSTVVVGVFSWSYGEISHAREKRLHAEEMTQMLRLEIGNRLDVIRKLETRFRSEHHSVIRSAIFGFQSGANVNPS